MIIDPYTWNTLSIASLDRLTPSVLSVTVPKPAGYTFRAGQYVVMRVVVDGAPLMRQYSIASAPHSDHLEFLIQREPNGVVTNWFYDTAKIGDVIAISQPFGHFVLDNGQQHLTLIAGRVGIAPFLSMVREQIYEDDVNTLQLLYSARGNDDFCYKDLLNDTGATLFNTQKDERITHEILQTLVNPHAVFYICGSKQFADSLAASLYQLGVPIESIKRELFTLQ